MNLLTSYNWLKEYVRVNESPEDFAKRAAISGVAVERIHPQAEAYRNMVVGKIAAVRPHPNADKLRIAETDLGGRMMDIVCGGSNLEPGMLVAVALEGAAVRWHGQGEPIVLAPTEIRGVKSEAMICGADEIGLGEAFPHAEKEILDLGWTKAKAGAPLAEALGADDVVFDIEVTTNRPDAFSVVGLAREASAIFKKPFLWKPAPLPKPGKGLDLSVKNAAPKLCSRYMAVALEGTKVAPSPWWLQRRLLAAGLRPISNVVDVTAYVMLELGQPLHAFDYDKLSGQKIVVREAEAGEAIALLDGSEKKLAPGMLVIADAERPAAVAGVMGGRDSSVTAATTRVVIEAATFDEVSVRRTARGITTHTDASLRFEKGLPPELAEVALARAVELLAEIAGGTVASEVVDVWPKQTEMPTFRFRPEKAAQLIGVDIAESEMVENLEALGFDVKKGKKGEYDVTVPYWRAKDIEDERDFTEEVARLHGYHNLPSALPSGELSGSPRDATVEAAMSLKNFFAGAGFSEIVSYSFISKEALDKSGVSPEDAIALANPLTSDFAYMRTSLIPSMLMTIKENQGLFPDARLFEVARVYPKKEGGIPDNVGGSLAVMTGVTDPESAFRALRGAAEAFMPAASLAFVRKENAGRWHPGRTAEIHAEGKKIGMIGELHPLLCASFGVDGRVFALELDRDAAFELHRQSRTQTPASPFPPVRRDLAIIVDEAVAYDAIAAACRQASELLSEIELFDIYRGKGVGEGKKSLAFHLTFIDRAKTLTAEAADSQMAAIRSRLERDFGAAMRS